MPTLAQEISSIVYQTTLIRIFHPLIVSVKLSAVSISELIIHR